MKGDFARDSFDKRKHYTSVRMQQGRVQLDADWNEQIDILTHLDRVTRRDVIGSCGGPQGRDREGQDLAGFKIIDRDGKLFVTRGRYYVEGILCENEAEVALAGQPHLPGFEVPDTVGQEGFFLAYLDVWERHVTALEDPDIREVALGGPDTATRAQTIWQVKLEAVDADATCSRFGADWAPPGTTSSGRLATRAEPGSDSDELCLTPAGAGYRRLENQLYRVEIHRGGGVDEATFKWSRENGYVVKRWDDQDGDMLRASSSGRDSNLGFAAGHWVELTDDTRELNGQPGILVQLAAVEGELLTIDPTTINDPNDPAADSVAIAQFPLNPKIRRWEMPNGAEVVSVPAANEGWILLEDGLGIQFDPSGTYQTGDYWQIPRTALGDVLWPADEAGEPSFQQRLGIQHVYCPLALMAPEGDVGRALVKISDSGEVEPDLAATFEAVATLTTADGNATWAFNLIEGLSQADGAPITAKVFSDILKADPDRLTNLVRAEAIDDFTLSIDLNRSLVKDRFFQELSEIQIDVVSLGAGITDCRSLFPPLTQIGDTGRLPEAGIRIIDLRLDNGEQLINDANVPITSLARGIDIVSDAGIDPISIEGRPTCSVTLEVPIPFSNVDRRLWGSQEVIGFQPLKLRAEVSVVDNVIKWVPLGPTALWLQKILFEIIDGTGIERVLAHLTLKGNFIWSATTPLLYLNGEAFGLPQSIVSDHNLRLSSGSRQGSDLKMWFWLIPG